MQTKLRTEKKDMAEERRKCRAISKENKQFKETVEAQERMIESQSFVMTNLRNGIDYLKATCKNTGEIQMNGCQWAEWAPWSVCSKVRAVLYCTVYSSSLPLLNIDLSPTNICFLQRTFNHFLSIFK